MASTSPSVESPVKSSNTDLSVNQTIDLGINGEHGLYPILDVAPRREADLELGINGEHGLCPILDVAPCSEADLALTSTSLETPAESTINRTTDLENNEEHGLYPMLNVAPCCEANLALTSTSVETLMESTINQTTDLESNEEHGLYAMLDVAPFCEANLASTCASVESPVKSSDKDATINQTKASTSTSVETPVKRSGKDLTTIQSRDFGSKRGLGLYSKPKFLTIVPPRKKRKLNDRDSSSGSDDESDEEIHGMYNKPNCFITGATVKTYSEEHINSDSESVERPISVSSDSIDPVAPTSSTNLNQRTPAGINNPFCLEGIASTSCYNPLFDPYLFGHETVSESPTTQFETSENEQDTGTEVASVQVTRAFSEIDTSYYYDPILNQTRSVSLSGDCSSYTDFTSWGTDSNEEKTISPALQSEEVTNEPHINTALLPTQRPENTFSVHPALPFEEIYDEPRTDTSRRDIYSPSAISNSSEDCTIVETPIETIIISDSSQSESESRNNSEN